VRLSVGKDPADATARRQRKEAELNALNNGVSVLPENGNGQAVRFLAHIFDLFDSNVPAL
jgi:hypothetical protein